MVLQTALAALLTRLGAGTDIPLGTPVAGRTDESLEDLVGFFVNTLVLRTDTSGNPTFRELLARVRETDLAAFAHQDLPFERIVEALNPERSLARHPLFQAMIVLQSQAAQIQGERDLGTRAVGPLEIDLVPEPDMTAKFDLTAAFSEIRTSTGEAAGLVVSFEYATELFDRSTIELFLVRTARLLEAMAADPDTPIGAVEIVTREEKGRLLAGLAGPVLPMPGATLAEEIQRTAARLPDAAALIAEDRTLTYRELDEAARHWAGRLAALGAGPEKLVAIAIPRGPELITGMLAILYAGAAYLPLDPDYPAERTAFMLADAAPAVLLTTANTAATVATAGLPTVLIDADVDGPVARPRPAAPGHPAYVMYTSGSTGRPKGVVIPHEAVVNQLRWRQDHHRLTPGDRVLVKTPSSFDTSVLEMFWPLVAGSAMVIARPGGHRDPSYLAGLIRRERVTTVEIVPSVLAALLEEPAAAECGSLRRVLAAAKSSTPRCATGSARRCPAWRSTTPTAPPRPPSTSPGTCAGTVIPRCRSAR